MRLRRLLMEESIQKTCILLVSQSDLIRNKKANSKDNYIKIIGCYKIK